MQPVSSIKIENINSNGIYFKREGNIRKTKGQISIINTLDISEIETSVNKIIKQSQGLGTICIKHKLECNEIQSEVLKHTSRIDRRLDDIYGLLGIRSNRNRRGLINIVGSGLKGLFGTMDNEDSEYYEKTIRTMQSNSENLQNSLKSQIVIMKSLNEQNKALHNSYYSHEDKINELVDKLNNLAQHVDKVNKEIIVNKYFERIHRQILDKTLALDIETDIIQQAIFLLKSNFIHPVILKPSKLIEILEQSTNKHSLLFEPSIENYNYLIEESEVKSYLLGKKIIIIVEIPLVEERNIELFEIITLPVIKGKNVFTLDINANHFLINENREEFGTFLDFKQCKKIKEYYICKNLVLQSTIRRDNCILNIYMSRSVNDCKFNQIQNDIEIFHALDSNKYLFLVKEETKYNCKCKSEEKIDYIQGTGILYLESNCRFSTLETYLSTNNETFTYVNNDKYNFGLDDCLSTKLEDIKTNSIPLTKIKGSLKNINDLSIELKNEESFIENLLKPIPTKVQGVAFLTFAIVLTFVIAYIIIKIVKVNKIVFFQNCFNKRNRNPVIEREKIVHYYNKERPTSRVLKLDE